MIMISKDTKAKIILRRYMEGRFLYIGYFVVLAFSLTNCYTNVDGCIDPESTNYAISADNPCDDCCVYPVVKLSIFHQSADTTFFLNDTLTNALGQEYAIIKYAYLLSDFRLTLSDGEIVQMQDSIQLNTATGTQYVRDDVIRVRRDLFTSTLGTAIFDIEGVGIDFLVGLRTELNKNEFTSAITGHPLTNDPDSLYRSVTDGYTFQRIQVAQGIDFRDTVIYDIYGEDAIRVSFPVDFSSLRGTDKSIIIEARYDEWFFDVDFETMSKSEIEDSAADNSMTMFSAREE